MRSLLTALIGLLCGAVSPAADYHVDQRAGDDAHDGRSPAQAWRSLAQVNATTFGPGDRILLRAGSVWEGEALRPLGSGTPECGKRRRAAVLQSHRPEKACAIRGWALTWALVEAGATAVLP